MNKYLLAAAIAVASLHTTAATLTFQQGVNDYAGTHDTRIGRLTNNPVGGATSISVQQLDTAGLVRFADIFGSSQTQIGANMAIVSATLTLSGGFASGGPTVLHDLLLDWDEATTTYRNFAGGDFVQTNGIEASIAGMAVMPGPVRNSWVFDVTESLRDMQSGALSGYGWMLKGTAANTSHSFATSEWNSIASRPLLTVEVAPVPEPATYAMMLAGLAAVGACVRRRRNVLTAG